MENINMKKYNNRKLSDNFYEVYIGDKRREAKNISAYTLSCALFSQILFGNEKSFKFSFIVSSISGIITVISNHLSYFLDIFIPHIIILKKEFSITF